MSKLINNYLEKSMEGLKKLKKNDPKNILKAANLIVKAFKNKKKMLICGNGGSASDSQHFAAELVGRFKKERKPFPAISLNTDTSAITAIGNDYNYSKIFSRQIEGVGNSGDILFLISTSGKSENIINATKTAKEKRIKTIGLTGSKESILSKNCDICILVPSAETCHIQELHIKVIHLLCILIEKEF